MSESVFAGPCGGRSAEILLTVQRGKSLKTQKKDPKLEGCSPLFPQDFHPDDVLAAKHRGPAEPAFVFAVVSVILIVVLFLLRSYAKFLTDAC